MRKEADIIPILMDWFNGESAKVDSLKDVVKATGPDLPKNIGNLREIQGREDVLNSLAALVIDHVNCPPIVEEAANYLQNHN